jgi:dipeptidyl aminopeptidase/acylaminoacyl peptidase
MTTERRLTNELPDILGDLAMGPYPDYIDDVLATTAEVRQRSAWTFPERWIPMVDTVRQPAFVPRLPWRSIAMAAVLLALLLAAAAIYIGSRQRVPAPFGPARNGLIAYEAGGDIFTGDPANGAGTAIVSGPEQDVGPRFSLDGRLVAFERKVEGGRKGQLYVVRSDGSNLTLVTPEPLALAPGDVGRAWEKYEFSPDGKALLIATMTGGFSTMTIAQTDGTGVRELDVGVRASEPSFRPPDGAEILFIGTQPSGRGLFVVDLDNLKVTEVLKLDPGFDLAGASWSPDGARIAYWTWGPGNGLTAKTHVIAADGTGGRELPSPPGAVWNAHATWSNDGTRFFIARAYTGGFEDVRGVVIPADGSNFGFEVARHVETQCCAAWLWSPDDSKVLGRSTALIGGPRPPIVIDIASRQAIPAPWAVTSDPTWQRLAP